MKKSVLSVLLLISMCSAFSQKHIQPRDSDFEIEKFIRNATGIKSIIGFYSFIISKDSAVLGHLAYYDNSGKQILLYDKQVDSLLVARGCREKIYPEIKKYLNL